MSESEDNTDVGAVELHENGGSVSDGDGGAESGGAMVKLTTADADEETELIPGSEDPGCLGLGCIPKLWQQVVILVVILAVVAAILIPVVIMYGGFRDFSTINIMLMVHGSFDTAMLGIPFLLFTDLAMPNYLGGPEMMKRIGFGPGTEALNIARTLFQYIGAVTITVAVSAVIVGVFGCRYMVQYFFIAWLSVDVLLIPLNLTMIFRWKKLGGTYIMYILMCCFNFGSIIVYGSLLGAGGFVPDSNCCYDSC